ncbi:class I adenylate-forming enzyme family protein [Streptomyces fuscichromogenes]|uniref:class I adenylate-forming enzyme family protein n=1 Tax=Streptomyces fuscichromogenes TaxID=1324013 RepID=UPI0016705A3B|nr:class I adenylate-forming enzyme family protein [Streptomyces fuscichromogenes]
MPQLPYRPTVPAVLRRAADRFGDDDYIVLPDRRISFRQAEIASRRLAKELLASGAGKGTRVGIHLPSGPEWAVAFLAVTRIGAIAMPFSTLYRPPELRAAIRAGDVSVLVSAPLLLGKDNETQLEDAISALGRSSPGRLRDPEVPYLRSVRLVGDSTRAWAEPFGIRTEGGEEEIGGVEDRLLRAVEAEVTPADQGVVVFTSGTTADPKAVVHSQGAVLRKTAPTADAALNAIFGGRVLCLMPFFWIGGMQEMLAALHSGAAILTLERLDAAAGLDLGRRERATSVMGNPQTMRSLLGATDLESVIPSLRDLPERPWDGPPSSRGQIPNGIGMTETFGGWNAVRGFECRVVDPVTGDLLGEGAVGEFQVRGYSLMQGLYKHEREEVFTPDGFYATGDLGYTEKGQFYFSARLKDMIKTKGANVAPAEVETVLNRRPEVRVSFVVGLPHEAHGEQVVAGVVAEHGHVLDVEALLEECRVALSPFKVPTDIHVLADTDIPVLASNKPDRRAIATLLATRQSLARRRPV